MAEWQLKTPVVFIIFNRPDTTEKVFRTIAQAKPRKLLVVADGPRADRQGEEVRCAAARAVIDRVDWDCQVLRNFSNINLGCGKRVSSGLDWVFGLVEEAIVLEDDCVPHRSFFRFCDELLEKYRGDERVMAISGDNFQFGRRRTGKSYYFSRYNHCWGWATWRRAWQYYDHDMKLWPEIRDTGWLEDLLSDPSSAECWSKILQRVYEGQIDTWAYRWTFGCWIQSGLCILPSVNLVSNIGFREDATHTRGDPPWADMPVESMRFPLQHPAFVIRDARADGFTQETHYGANRRSTTAELRRYFRAARRRLRALVRIFEQ